MTTYRVFIFDMGHINAVVEFDAPDDETALKQAKAHFPGEQRELWEGTRFVARLPEES
jgi:hypothetical protein